LVIGGNTSSNGFPTTGGALDPTSHGLNSILTGVHEVSGFVALVNPNGSALVYSTCMGYTFRPGYIDVLSALHIAADGNVVVAGTAEQLPFGGAPNVVTSQQFPFLAKLNATGSSVVFGDVFNGPQEQSNTVNDMVIDSSGNMWITGAAPSGLFAGVPDPNPVLGTFVAEVPADGLGLSRLYRFDTVSVGKSISVTGDGVLALGSAAVVYKSAASPPGAVLAVCNAALGPCKPTRAVAPGEFITIYGDNLGPAPGVGAALDQNGRIATSLAGLQIDFAGVPAPILYAGSDQINLIVPWQVKGPRNVRKDGVLIRSIPLNVNIANLQLLALVNEDGTLNAPENPAPIDSTVTAYLNGAKYQVAPADGAISTADPVALSPAMTASQGVTITYQGSAPGQVFAVQQVNLLIVGTPTNDTVTLSQNGANLRFSLYTQAKRD
jgi:uncharacterized protein (TIGR03437 family)